MPQGLEGERGEGCVKKIVEINFFFGKFSFKVLKGEVDGCFKFLQSILKEGERGPAV